LYRVHTTCRTSKNSGWPYYRLWYRSPTM
jgi:hypothetical protein